MIGHTYSTTTALSLGGRQRAVRPVDLKSRSIRGEVVEIAFTRVQRTLKIRAAPVGTPQASRRKTPGSAPFLRILHFLATFHCQKRAIGRGVESGSLGSIG